MTKYQKILGGLLAGAVGDAMGAATETRNMDQMYLLEDAQRDLLQTIFH